MLCISHMFWFVIRRCLFFFNAESVHHFAFYFLRLLGWFVPDAPVRRRCHRNFQLAGQRLSSPLGLAAGFDKDAKALSGLMYLGFGFIEIGSVTLRPQAGNPKPRLFRLPHSKALINRMGFNSDGADVVLQRMQKWRQTRRFLCPIGVNLGKNKETPLEDAHDEYGVLIERFYDVADYLVINISSPNTPGLRDLQSRDYLPKLLSAVQAKRDACARTAAKLPLFLKISPDLAMEDCLFAVDTALASDFAGVIATNTSNQRDLPGISAHDEHLLEKGGLSGRPLASQSLAFTQSIRNHMGAGPTLISVGGIDSQAEVVARLDAGADLVQAYTAFIYEGPSFPARIRDSF